MTIVCPWCGRKQDVEPERGQFVMPPHDNYTKTEPCGASGTRYELRDDTAVRLESRPGCTMPGASLMLALLAGMDVPMPRHRGGRRWGRRR